MINKFGVLQVPKVLRVLKVESLKTLININNEK
jgi:hypothetical protein